MVSLQGLKKNLMRSPHGKLKWNKMIDDFYIPFKKDVENTIENAERISGERELGIDPVIR